MPPWIGAGVATPEQEPASAGTSVIICGNAVSGAGPERLSSRSISVARTLSVTSASLQPASACRFAAKEAESSERASAAPGSAAAKASRRPDSIAARCFIPVSALVKNGPLRACDNSNAPVRTNDQWRWRGRSRYRPSLNASNNSSIPGCSTGPAPASPTRFCWLT